MLKLTPPGGFGIPHQLFDANGKFVNDGTQKFFQDVVHAHETAGSWAISNFFLEHARKRSSWAVTA